MRIENDFTNLTISNYLNNHIKNSEKKRGNSDSADFINSNFELSEVDNRNNLVTNFSKVIQRDINELQVLLQEVDNSKELLLGLEEDIKEKEIDEIKIKKSDEMYKDLFSTLFNKKRGVTTIIIEEGGKTSVVTVDGGSQNKTVKVSKDKNTGSLGKSISDSKKAEEKFYLEKDLKKKLEEEIEFLEFNKEEVEKLKDEKVKELILTVKPTDNGEVEKVVEEVIVPEVFENVESETEEVYFDDLFIELEDKEEQIKHMEIALKERLDNLEEGKLEDDRMIEYLEAKQLFEKMRDEISSGIEMYLSNHYRMDGQNVYRLLK